MMDIGEEANMIESMLMVIAGGERMALMSHIFSVHEVDHFLLQIEALFPAVHSAVNAQDKIQTCLSGPWMMTQMVEFLQEEHLTLQVNRHSNLTTCALIHININFIKTSQHNIESTN